jgi:predicted PurR-regulated permease PerM
MSRFRQGLLSGLILSVVITLAIALMWNEERRRQLSSRLEKLWKTLPRMKQLKQSAQKATSRAQKTGSISSELVQESAGKLAQHTQEILSIVQKKAASLGEQ